MLLVKKAAPPIWISSLSSPAFPTR